MIFKEAEMRIAKGMPLGLKLTINLNPGEVKLLSIAMKDADQRFGFTLKETELIIAPGNSAATIEQITNHIKPFLMRHPELAGTTVATDLLQLAENLKKIDSSDPMQLGKSKGAEEKEYKAKVDDLLSKFNSEAHQQEGISHYMQGIGCYKTAKFDMAKSHLENFTQLYQRLNEKEQKELSRNIVRATATTALFSKAEDLVKTATQLIDNIDKLLEMKKEEKKPEPRQIRPTGLDSG